MAVRLVGGGATSLRFVFMTSLKLTVVFFPQPNPLSFPLQIRLSMRHEHENRFVQWRYPKKKAG